MQLSKRAQYGLRALICLADAYDQGYLQSHALARRERLPAKFLESIMSALTRGKFLNSKLGAAGGYRLARPPEDIRVADILDRLEGSELLEEKPGSDKSQRPGEVAVRLVESMLSQALHDAIADTTLAQLAERATQAERAERMYYI